MRKTDFLSMVRSGPVILDGATGTNLQKAGMPSGVCPEVWVLENSEKLQSLQKAFFEAGSNIVYAFSFGANRIKLSRHGQPSDRKSVEEINQRLGKISCSVRDQMIQSDPEKVYLVAGDLSPTGLFLKPAGELDFDELVDIYREQVRGLAAAGVDLFVVETMLDLAQTRAAVIAIRLESDLPVMASLTIEKNGRTLSGDAVRSSLIALAALDIQAFGLNCSFGPELMADFFKELPLIENCALLAKPNAGIPHLDENGLTQFDMQPDDFAYNMAEIYSIGVRVLGGCCGTTPEHIAALNSRISQYRVPFQSGAAVLADSVRLPAESGILSHDEEKFAYIGSARIVCSLENWRSFPILKCTDQENIIDELLDLADDEPEGICVEIDCLGDLSSASISELLAEIQMNISIPLIFISDNEHLQILFARYYNGLTAFVSTNIAECKNAFILEA